MIFRDPLNFDGDGFKRSQDFGPTGLAVEPKVVWPGTDGSSIAKGTYPRFHQGVDWYNGKSGSPVYAAASGIADFASVDGTGSRIVILNHGRYRTWYGHLSKLNTKKGAKVAAGKVIGYVGQSGNATGPHLHFAVEWLDMPGKEIAYGKSGGTWTFDFVEPERLLARNVTVHPDGPTVNLRETPGAGLVKGPVYAQSKADGRIHRASDDADLGATDAWRDWKGTVKGATYEGRNDWEGMELDNRTVYCAAKYAVLSAR